MKDFIKVMKALSDPNRVKILKMLQHKADVCLRDPGGSGHCSAYCFQTLEVP